MPANQPSVPTLPNVWKHTVTVLLGVPDDAEEYAIFSNWVINKALTQGLDNFYDHDESIFDVGDPAMVYKKQSKGGDINLTSTMVSKLHGLWRYMHIFPEPNADGTVNDIEDHMDKTTGKFTFLQYHEWEIHTAFDMRKALIKQFPAGSSSPGLTTPSTPRQSSPSTVASPGTQQLLAFKKGIKCDVEQYPTLKDERYFDSFSRSVYITATSHDCSDVLIPSFVPGPDPDALELYQQKKIFMYTVFNANVLTDMGKSFITQHAHDMDAQKVWAKLTNHMKSSTKGAIERCEIQQYVCTAVYDSPFQETTQAFVLHFNEQFHRHDNITEPAHQIPYLIRLTLLQHAVSKVPELRMVETMEKFRLVVSNHGSKPQPHLQYSTYFDLLISACIKHDKPIENKLKSRTRNIYAHQVEDIPWANEDDFQPDLQSGTMDGGIDLSPIDYMQVPTA
ncbi:hypothetical protein ACA910_003411 [Epithemia clementina (nom. ined.)]